MKTRDSLGVFMNLDGSFKSPVQHDAPSQKRAPDFSIFSGGSESDRPRRPHYGRRSVNHSSAPAEPARPTNLLPPFGVEALSPTISRRQNASESRHPQHNLARILYDEGGQRISVTDPAWNSTSIPLTSSLPPPATIRQHYTEHIIETEHLSEYGGRRDPRRRRLMASQWDQGTHPQASRPQGNLKKVLFDANISPGHQLEIDRPHYQRDLSKRLFTVEDWQRANAAI